MVIKNVGGYVGRWPEKSQERSFLDKVKRGIENFGNGIQRNMRRKDQHFDDRNYGDNQAVLNREERDKISMKEDIKDALQGDSDLEKNSELMGVLGMEYDDDSDEPSEGEIEYKGLKRRQNTKDGVLITDETVFSDGENTDGDYLGSPTDMTKAEEDLLIAKSEKEKREREFDKAESEFYRSRREDITVPNRGGKMFR